MKRINLSQSLILLMTGFNYLILFQLLYLAISSLFFKSPFVDELLFFTQIIGKSYPIIFVLFMLVILPLFVFWLKPVFEKITIKKIDSFYYFYCLIPVYNVFYFYEQIKIILANREYSEKLDSIVKKWAIFTFLATLCLLYNSFLSFLSNSLEMIFFFSILERVLFIHSFHNAIKLIRTLSKNAEIQDRTFCIDNIGKPII